MREREGRNEGERIYLEPAGVSRDWQVAPGMKLERER